MAKKLMVPDYRRINFVCDDDGETFNDQILDRYDEHVSQELRRQVEEGLSDAVLSKFVTMAAESRVQLTLFLESPSHGPH